MFKQPIRITIGIFMLIFSLNSFAQVQKPVYTSMTPISNGYYEYLPQGYNNNPNEKFPLLIFVHGLGECGNGTTELSKVLTNGTPRLINQGTFPTSFTSGGQTFKFIILSPQFTNWPGYAQIYDILNYAVTHYKVDIDRIYLTGLSMGGGCVWEYAGFSKAFAERVAAIVPVCGASGSTQERINNMADANLPVWATHNNTDPTVNVIFTNQYVDGMNSAPHPPNPLAKKSIFYDINGHDAWSRTYDPNYRENGMNVYEWMLSYKRNFSALPVTGMQFSANKKTNASALLSWSTYSEINNKGFYIERSSNGTQFTNIGFVAALSANNNGASYQFTDEHVARGNNYYRIRQVDLDGTASLSESRLLNFDMKTAVAVFPNPAADFVQIDLGYTAANCQIEIINTAGQRLRQFKYQQQNNIKINVTSLPTGIYSIRITSDGNRETRQVKIK